MTKRQRFLQAATGHTTDRPPVWIMRQAGRYLPEYRALKEKYSFVEMVRTPELAEHVTLQPLQRFALDAAILFSDILVIPEALGQPYHFKEQGGIAMDFTLSCRDDIDRLNADSLMERLDYVPQTLRRLRSTLGDTTALLGFGGSPWTLAVYMIQGGSDSNGVQLKHFAIEQPRAFNQLMEILSSAIATYFDSQVEAGADALQIFDSWGALCPGDRYWEWSLRWIADILSRMQRKAPIILYAKGMTHHHQAIKQTGVSILSADWSVRMSDLAAQTRDQLSLQGNLDPVLMSMEPAHAVAATKAILHDMQGYPGFIFNLGHGIMPSARIDTVAAVVDAVTAGTSSD